MRFRTLLTFAFSVALASPAFAAGYTCLSVDQDTQAIVYMDAPSSTQAKQIAFIDPSLSVKSQILAVFSADAGAIETSALKDGLRFTSKVDASTPGSGKHLGGTKLGLLEKIVVDVQTVTKKMQIQEFTEGSMYAGQVSYTKKDGQVLTQDFDCALFLGEGAPVVQNR